jgi:cytochrome c biogenesis protein CcdA/thiol-disulfide isomerase/thioredoxin
MTLALIAFFAGILTVLSPCVLPLLPVIVGGSLAGGTSYRRAITVTVSLGISVFLFTFLLKVSTIFISVPPAFWNWLSGGILFIVGIFFIFPNLWDLIPGTARANRDSTQLMSKGFMRQSFWGDVLVGAALGPVFSTCSPTYFIVLATVLPISLALGTADILAYILGLCLFLLVIAYVGQRFLARLNLAADSRGWFKRTIGILFIIIAILIVTNSLAAIESPLYNVFDETKVEQYFLQGISHNAPPAGSNFLSSTTEQTVGTSTSAAAATPPAYTFLTPAEKASRYQLAPELVSPDAYLNTNGQPITLAQFRGKDVVLLDFWTYSCINCQRTIPYLTAWYAKYKNQGLVVIGVHTPEFAFEHLESNVEAALQEFGITYPVVLDNEYKTWDAYQNEYWPHDYVIDIDGYIIYDQAGEGNYVQTEQAIQYALAERAARLGLSTTIATSTVSVAPTNFAGIQSPETYFGSNRNEYLGNGNQGVNGTQSFLAPDMDSLQPNTLYLGGSWSIMPEYATNVDAGATIEYSYSATNLYFVASGAPTGTQIEVLQDGVPLSNAIAGKDVVNGILTVSGSRLYDVVSNPTAGSHTIQFIVKSPGLQAYTFTFG